MNKRIFPRNKAVIFILNILLISVIVGLFSSIIGGVGARQFYVNSDNNVVTIVNPEVKTPAVSYIPNSLVNIFQGMKGVTVVSPEIYSLILINNKPATLHGITSNFTKLVNIKNVEGDRFQNISNQDLSLGIFAGKSIADDLGLQIGSNYIIYSTISDSFVSFKLLGIISFNSFYNEELFTSLANSNFFRPVAGKNDVSMIRIKYNPNILSTNSIYSMINNYHQVTIQVVNPQSGALNGIQVTAVTIDGYYEGSGTTDYNGRTSFNLPLGDYVFLISYSSYSESFEKLIYNSTTIYFNLGQVYSGSQNNYNITANVYNYGKLISNAHLVLIDKYGNEIAFKTDNNQYLLNKIKKGNYTIQANWENQIEKYNIYLENNTNIDINFNQKVQMVLKTVNNIVLNTYSCQIYNFVNQTSTNIQDCSQSFFLPKAVYNITLESPIYGNFSQIIVVNDSTSTQQFSFIAGNIQTNFLIFLSGNNPYSNTPIYARSLTDKNFKLVGSTTNQGIISLDFPYNSEHILLFNSSTANNQIYYKSIKNENKTIILDNTKKLTIYAYNASLGENFPLSNVKITVRTLSNTIYTNTTTTTGLASFSIGTNDILIITLSVNQYTKSIIVDTFNSGDEFKYPLGMTHISIVAINDYGATVGGVSVNYISSNGNKTYVTTSNGRLDFYFNPLATQSFLEQANAINLTENIGNNLPLAFLQQYFYVFDINYNKITNQILIPKSYFSSFVSVNTLTPYIFTATIRIVNAANDGVPNAILQLTSQKVGNKISLVTNQSGEATTNFPSDGSYSVIINDVGKQFTYNLVMNLNQNYYTIQIFTFGSSVKVFNYLGGVYSALTSSQYQSNFYSTTTTIFIQLGLILLLVVVIILIFSFSSAILLTFESIHKEIAIVQIIGGTNRQITWNLLAQLSIRALLASIFGYFLGFLTTIVFPSLNNVQLVGFIINPMFNPVLFTISIITVNILSIITLIQQLTKFNWKNPISNIKF